MYKALFITAAMMGCFSMAVSQTEVTSQYIKNASFESGFTRWESSNLQIQSNTSFTAKAGTIYLEKWVSKGSAVGNASLYQTLEGLPVGTYRLTAAAQNLNQNSTSTKCAGAYLVAGEEKTPVYTPGDYSVDFTNVYGTVKVGFLAESAKGNWLAVDNFRLYLLDTLTNAVLLDTLSSQIQQAESLSNQAMEASALNNLQQTLTNAKNITDASTTTAIQSALLDLKEAIETAQFAIILYNATPGSGSAPKVTVTNPYVATGATQALVRATMTGSNILEKGVCWSTHHMPTVLDDRTTKSFSLNGTIFHVKGLNPATVYYIRPYVMNKTYTVAYGEEIKIVTHPAGNCVGTWDEGAPSVEANVRCRIAIKQTIEYFNEWTGIKGFTLSGHYGADTPTADCSYGGWMRIGPNAGNQAIGTVIHETGHGVGVGTSSRWTDDANYHDWSWKGREANEMYQFLENKKGDAAYYMVGDPVHGWGQNATYDWFVNGADKDTHSELQYIGGCALLYSLFVDGLCPTSSYTNGLAGYTYNFEDTAKYYIMCKDAERGLGVGLLQSVNKSGSYRDIIVDCLNSDDPLPAAAAWYMEYDANSGMYRFKNAGDGRYISHAQSLIKNSIKATPGSDEAFQLIPDRTDVTLTDANQKNTLKVHGYWLAWYASGNKALSANTKTYSGVASPADFISVEANASKQQWIILTEAEVLQLKGAPASAIQTLSTDSSNEAPAAIYNLSGCRVAEATRGLYLVGNKKIMIK